ncbi:hypothetical protein AS888_18415 [Peribacillus simplex]|uniref:Uncharacterized protein n=1 Tax=Peribacillus simplex TaxID=1478 RepID=A0A109MYQ7_9BACI|nr:hypothetical protein AS888_18415 [Peribacillus simplex]
MGSCLFLCFLLLAEITRTAPLASKPQKFVLPIEEFSLHCFGWEELRGKQYKGNYFSVVAFVLPIEEFSLHCFGWEERKGKQYKGNYFSVVAFVLPIEEFSLLFFYINPLVFSNTRVEFKGELKQWVF